MAKAAAGLQGAGRYKNKNAAAGTRKLHMLHAVLETPKTEKGPNEMRIWRGRGTKTPAGARWNVAREREIKSMSAKEFTNPLEHHPNRKVSKTRVKAALLLDSFECKKMNEGCAG